MDFVGAGQQIQNIEHNRYAKEISNNEELLRI